MSEAKHTPGEWEVGGGLSAEHVRTADGKVIADCCKTPTAAEGRANARLIAAAPGLLAACEQSLKWLKIDRDAGLISDDVYHVRRETIIATIHKATKGD